jgi:hypothetical protein
VSVQIDQRYGRLTVVAPAPPHGQKRRQAWWCRCDCGKQILVLSYNLMRGNSTSCGCSRLGQAHNLKHGHARTGLRSQEYVIWMSMIQRCYDPNAINYSYYGGRGVRVHEPWRTSFELFLADVGHRPSVGHSLDRVDGTKGYVPGNVRWATVQQQTDNRRVPRCAKCGQVGHNKRSCGREPKK